MAELARGDDPGADEAVKEQRFRRMMVFKRRTSGRQRAETGGPDRTEGGA